jgi:CheY-like chemotaxis protein
MGAIVEVANNGKEGVVAALAQPHDVVLMDIQMPEMDGYQALAQLQHEGFSTPVVALTAHALNEERMRTRAAGFADHLTKPIDKAALLETLSSYHASPA